MYNTDSKKDLKHVFGGILFVSFRRRLENLRQFNGKRGRVDTSAAIENEKFVFLHKFLMSVMSFSSRVFGSGVKDCV